MKPCGQMLLVFWLMMISASALGKDVVLNDPEGDDNGPGTYTYPSASEYKKGSFDFTKVELSDKGDDVEIKLHLKVKLEDPWKSRDWPERGNGFSLQMAFLFVDQDHKPGSGHAEGIPGLNIRFKEDARWEKAVILSPQGSARLHSEINIKAKSLKSDIVVPKKVKVSGKKIIVTVFKKDFGSPAAGWGYQLAMQSNEGYPDKNDLLTRPVNQNRGEHRFGGGRDDNCDPHVFDILTGSGKGSADEIAAQHEILKAFSCSGDPSAFKLAELPMVYP